MEEKRGNPLAMETTSTEWFSLDQYENVLRVGRYLVKVLRASTQTDLITFL